MPVTMVIAMTADGKIAPVDRRPLRFGAGDLTRLEQRCAAADALVMGAGTLRAYGTTVRPLTATPPVTCVVTASGELDLTAAWFTKQTAPRMVFTTAEGAARLGAEGAALAAIEVGASPLRAAELYAALTDRGCADIVLLGGGACHAWWLAGAPLDAVELTLAPLMLGGASAPTPVDGPGLPCGLPLRLAAVEPAGDLLHIRYEAAR